MSKRYQGGVLGVGFNPLQAPNAPTIGTATGGNTSATVPFTAPANVGGSAITGYTGRSNPGDVAATASASPLTFSGLTNGTSYTFGVFALNSYGPSPISAFSNTVVPAVPDGTFSIFALGNNQCTRNKYTYSGCVSSSATAGTVGSSGQSAAGNSTVGIFALGFTSGFCGSFPVTTRNKYTYVGCVVSAGGAATVPSYDGSAAGNSTIGIFALGYDSGANRLATRNKYTYSGDVVSAGGAATTASYVGSAVGNSTRGIFALGCAGCTVTTRDKYTYSGCVVSAGGAATVASKAGAAAGNSTVGIFALGINVSNTNLSTRDKYTYSSDVVSAGSAATDASRFGAAAGNSTVGIFALGAQASFPVPQVASTTRNRYTYAGDVNAAATASSGASQRGSAASNGIIGITI
jgi:hypothetical protein